MFNLPSVIKLIPGTLPEQEQAYAAENYLCYLVILALSEILKSIVLINQSTKILMYYFTHFNKLVPGYF